MYDFNEALDAARREAEKIIDADPELNRSEVEEIRLEREDAEFWFFAAEIPKLIKEGWVPGAITVIVGKNDGRVLSEKEQIDFHKNWKSERRIAGFIKPK